MYRSRSPLVLSVLVLALLTVPAALAKGRDHRAFRTQGVCTQQSTSKLKIKREDGRLEVEFEVDQNQTGVPWTVTLSRNDAVVKSFTATTVAPSGSFEIHRRLHGRLGTDTIKVVATSPSGETCTADTALAPVKAQSAAPAPTAGDNDVNDDNNDDNGGDHHGGGDDGGRSGGDA
jgi:hypothetical protein